MSGTCPREQGILHKYHGWPISGLCLSHSELPKSLAILFVIRGRVVEDFVFLEKGVDLHPRLENKEPPKLFSSHGTRPIIPREPGFREPHEADPSTSTQHLWR